MSDKLNCPNCGAPIPTYIHTIEIEFMDIPVIWNDQIIMSRVVTRTATIKIEYDALPNDDGVTIRQERRTE